MQISQINSASELNFIFPSGFSFFEPYLSYNLQEILEIGGEVYTARTREGSLTGIFIYDNCEKGGTIYTRSKEIFDYFYALKPFNFLFSEMQTGLENEIYDIFTINLKDHTFAHRFSYEISVANTEHAEEVEHFMALTHPRLNKKWVRVALKNGDRCFIVKLDDEIAGLGWVSLVNGVGRLHSLFVQPQFRRMGIGEDILNARLLWLKSNRAHSAFCEISRYNVASAANVIKANMSVLSQVYQYFRKIP
jgi:ribosomal protein S18 acetylase RimI-like enzyme